MRIRGLIKILPIMLFTLSLMTGVAHANLCQITGFVWHDLDCDGIQDPGEPGIIGVRAVIIRCGPDGIPGTDDDHVVDWTFTNTEGVYYLKTWTPDIEYFVRFDWLPPNVIGFSPQDQGTDDTIDSDPDPATGMTACEICECSLECEGEPGPPLEFDAGLCTEEGNGDLFPCPKTIGYWKNHLYAWPVDSLMLGSQTYDMDELYLLLIAPVRGDASLILAKQLIATKLNIANGTDPDPIDDTINSADAILSDFDGKLPYGVRPRTDAGKAMVQTAFTLDEYNNASLTPDCFDDDDDDDDCIEASIAR